MSMINLPCPKVSQAELDAWPEARERLKTGTGDVAGAIVLRNRLLVSVYPLVFQLIARYSAARPSVEFAALYEAAIYGMFNAVDGYDPTMGSWQHWAKLHARKRMLRVRPIKELLILDEQNPLSSNDKRGSDSNPYAPHDTRMNLFIGACPSTEDSVTFEWLDKGLDSLDGLEYELLVKCVIDDEELTYVARRHGISREWARLKKNRALKKLRQAHDDHQQTVQMA